MTAQEVADLWEISKDTVYAWAARLGVVTKRPPFIRVERVKNNSFRYRGFNLYRVDGIWHIKGSELVHPTKDTIKKFIDTYLRRTGQEAGPDAA